MIHQLYADCSFLKMHRKMKDDWNCKVYLFVDLVIERKERIAQGTKIP